MRNVTTKITLEVRFAVALIVLVIVSFGLLIPSLIYRPIWKLQNRVVDWFEDWAFEPRYKFYHPQA